MNRTEIIPYGKELGKSHFRFWPRAISRKATDIGRKMQVNLPNA
jgi:hypothetical protein